MKTRAITPEYGLTCVHTPILVVLGHTQYGAVTTAIRATRSEVTITEKNISLLIAPIMRAVEHIAHGNTNILDDNIISLTIEENVWQSIEDLLTQSPVTRNLVQDGKVKITGAIYDVKTG